MDDRQTKAHEWLNRNYTEWQEIQKLRQRLELSESLLANGVARYTKSEIQVMHSGNQQEDKLIEVSYLRGIVEDRLRELDKADAATIQIIAKVDGAELRNILLSRYILRQSWRSIEREMHISIRNLYRMRDRGLDQVAKHITWH